MNKSSGQTHFGFFHLSFLMALVMTMIPWGAYLKPIQPYWLAMIVAFWSLQRSPSIMTWAVFYGLLLDVLSGSLLGKHGMSLVALSYLIGKSSKQLHLTSFWQLMMMVLALLLNDLVIRAAIDWISYRYTPEWSDLLPLVSAAMVWPWLKYTLDRMLLSLKNK
ncbi:rod shape-determining protein MreD [Marinicella rhabdoformis]|uniref:rod shape-determining protein MreD n=1 Tax=Marinicella rhabdoformis TaxID=2580566 RepID=UPI0012AEC5A4|nr:rod shape-determining protein MreD [Marinicella rhabdoformis]